MPLPPEPFSGFSFQKDVSRNLWIDRRRPTDIQDECQNGWEVVQGPCIPGILQRKKTIHVITTLTTWVPYTRNRKIGIIKLSISDVMVDQKGSNGDQKLQLFGRDYNFTCTLRKIHLWAKIRN